LRINRTLANRNFLQIFFALLLVAVFMFVSNYIVFRNSISQIYDQVYANNRLVVSNIIQSYEESFKEINNLIYTLQTLPYDRLERKENGQVDMSGVYMLQKHLTPLSSSIDYIEDIVIFYNDLDLAITSAGTIDMKELFAKKYSHSVYNAPFWKSFTANNNSFKVFPSEVYTEIADEYRKIDKNLMVVVGSNKIRISEKNVMILINEEKLFKRVNQKTMMEGTALIVLDQDGNVIMNTEKGLQFSNVLQELGSNAQSEANLKGKDYEYNVYKSDLNGFTYIDKVPYKFNNIQSVTDANQYIMATTIIGAILLSGMLSVLLFRPVKAILTLFGEAHSPGAAFRNIYNGIMTMKEENESIKTHMSFIDSEMRRGVFLHALDEFSHSREIELQMQKYFADFFSNKQFVMVSLHLQPQHGSEHQTTLRIEQVTEAVKKGFGNLNQDAVVFHAGNLQYIALFSIEHKSDRKAVLEETESFVLRAGAEGLDGFHVMAVVSRSYVSVIKNCHLAYQDLKDGIMNRNIKIASPVIDVQSIRYTRDVYLPLDALEKLSNCLASGNDAEGVRIVNEILIENAERNIHYHQLAHIAESMFFQMMKQLDLPASEAKTVSEMESVFRRKISSSQDYKEVWEELVAVVRYVSGKNKQDQRGKLNPEFIAHYIEINYMENLYLDHMAETFKTTPKYFSNYFKKTFGVNFVEYLNKVRLTRAKDFLRNTTLSVSEIGEKIGYANHTTFASTFKKVYGITPSEYRKKPANDLKRRDLS